MLEPAVESVIVTVCGEVNDPVVGEMMGVAVVAWPPLEFDT
jgi:hypothetical protein